jgi:leader peptidase (prepilin peptidase) / N-methyltransferase
VIFLVVVAVFFGLVVGSFSNVVIHRVPLRQSIVWPSSRCPNCGAPIKGFDNVPLLSYLLLRGRCRECKARISPRYPLVERLTGLLFGLAAYEFGFSRALVPALVFIAVLILLAGTDLEHRLLPNAIVLPATVVGLVLSIVVDPARWWVYVVSAVAVAAGLFALVFAYPRGWGMGDVKMGGMLGAFLGPYAALAVFIGALAGALVGGVLMMTGKMGRRTAMPFGVFLAFAGVLVLFVGEDIWGAYAGLIGGV